MSTRVTYDELGTPHDLYPDCRKVGALMRADRIDRLARGVHAPQTRRALHSPAAATADVTVDEPTARLANTLYGG